MRLSKKIIRGAGSLVGKTVSGIKKLDELGGAGIEKIAEKSSSAGSKVSAAKESVIDDFKAGYNKGKGASKEEESLPRKEAK